MRYAWLAIIAVSLAPVALLALLANPVVFFALGPDAWRERVARLHPYRGWLVFSLLVCAFATAVYATTY